MSFFPFSPDPQFSYLHRCFGPAQDAFRELLGLAAPAAAAGPRSACKQPEPMFDSYAEIFAERGAAYHAAMAACPRARDAEFHAVLEPLRNSPEGLLCDLPSGGGYLAAHLPPGLRYVGVDPSDDFIDACPAGLDRIKADIGRRAARRCRRSIISSASRPSTTNPTCPQCSGEMRRLLRAGGRAVIADVAIDTAPARLP